LKAFSKWHDLISHSSLECRFKNFNQRAGVADDGVFYIRPTGTAAWIYDKA
jgi:hypothetical protein